MPASTLRRDCPRGARASHQRSAHASGTGGTTFSIISTGGSSHTGAEGREPHCEATKTVTGLRSPALGRSRGGLTSEIHLACDGSGRPLAFVLTGGNTNDCTQFTAVMDAIRVPRLGPGRPRMRPGHVIGDKGYSSRAIRTWLRCRGIAHTIPERSDQVRNRARRGSRGGRPPVFDKQVYKRRNVVERCFNRLKQWRGIATRYDKTAQSYQAAITLASLLMWA
ncbi:IS5 family transposase [Streptomyces sp. NRRL S-448]|uniref:IS5 family transposase n=1 Tax=Streptomyces sp. NRRL S-448 TaxID=1463907 RepID=UPI003561DE2F